MIEPVIFDDQAYIAPTWHEMGKLTGKLARMIKETNGNYDRLIALAKGGWGWARQLQDYLQIPELSGVQISFYADVLKTNKMPVVIQSLPISIRGERVLVYDDVADSGETLEMAQYYLKAHGAAKVETATHFTKSWSKSMPTYSAANTDAWIIFPHDAVESIRSLVKTWEGLEQGQVVDRLLKIGIESDIVDFVF